jgi:hypothetical protein
MDLPASEIEFWRMYYAIYPFPQERQDKGFAMLAATITNVIGLMLAKGKALRSAVSEKIFMPDYLGTVTTETPAPVKSPAEQRAEFAAFTAKYRSIEKQIRSRQRAT